MKVRRTLAVSLIVAAASWVGMGAARGQIEYNPSNSDYITIQRMKTAGEFLRDFYRDNGHLPQSPVEVDKAISDLADADPMSGTAPKEPNTKGYFRMSLDPSIGPNLTEQWKQRPPGNWQAPTNGLVTIISSGDRYFLIWGSGMNFGPILNPNNGHAIVVSGMLGKDAP